MTKERGLPPPEVHRVSRKHKQVTLFDRAKAQADKWLRRNHNVAIRGIGERVNGKPPKRGQNGQGK